MPDYAPYAKAALRNLLAADAVLTASLETYDFTTGQAEAAAIFTGRVPPDDAAFPCIFIEQLDGQPFDVRDHKGADLRLSVTLFGEKDQSDATLENLAWRAWNTLHRASPTCTGWAVDGCIADPPQQVNADAQYPAYRIVVRLLLTQS